ncbi:angiotensinogen [Heterodontus francisci]|uniref:angiotensinogen n=1 Tax=Heterodontus francisci TaxID=7792 RepID=UPI00355BE539
MKWIFPLLWLATLLELAATNRPYIHPLKLVAYNQTGSQKEMNQEDSFLAELSGVDDLSLVNGCGGSRQGEEEWKPSSRKQLALSSIQTALAAIWFTKLSPLEGSGITLLSPFHLYGSLAALSLGAGGATTHSFCHHLVLLEDGCGLGRRSWNTHRHIRLLNRDILTRQGGSLSTATWLVFRKGLQLRQTFIQGLRCFYPEVQLRATNVSQPHTAEETINGLIHNASAGRVSNLVTGLSPSTNLVLASYIHFKGKWKTRSQCFGTEFQDFFNDGGSKVRIPMMLWCGWVQYKIDPKYTLIKIPMSETTSMVLIQPIQPDLMQNIESTLPVNSIMKDLQSGDVRLVLPQFKWESTYDVKELYRRMQLADMLGSQANFSRLSSVQQLAPDQVVQSVIFDVTEDGEEPTPAGDVPFSNMTFTTEIRINKPFFFRVYDRTLGELLFLGKVKKLH